MCILVGIFILPLLAVGIYNIGFNSFLVLFTGAYTRTAIDLESAKGAFGDKKAFNVKTLLFSLPQMIIPILLFGVGMLLNNTNIGIDINWWFRNISDCFSNRKSSSKLKKSIKKKNTTRLRHTNKKINLITLNYYDTSQ